MWTKANVDEGVDAAATEAAARLMSQDPRYGTTLALLAVHRDRIVLEHYGPETDEDTTLISWSMAKSMIHACVGLLRDRIDLHAPTGLAHWQNDERRDITLQHLLNMRDGLDFTEDYVDAGVSHVIEMLFGEGVDDHAGYAGARPAAHPAGAVWNYSSGTTNIISRLLGDLVGGGRDGMERFLHDRLFAPIGMMSAAPKFDSAGTFVGSSYVYATARDFARFGRLYLHDGVWDGQRILPAGWVDHARTFTAADTDNGLEYGAHWWLWPDQPGSVAAHGYEGQYIVVVPNRDLILVRLGKTDAALRPNLMAELRTIVNSFPEMRANS